MLIKKYWIGEGMKKIIMTAMVFAFVLLINGTNANAADSDFTVNSDKVITAYSGTGGDIVLPDGAVSIGAKAFAGNTDITSVTMPNSIKKIEKSAFDSCSSLKSVTLSTKLTYIGDSAFWGCSALTSIKIPSKVTTIEYGAFCNCKNLLDIYVPDNVKTIGNYALGFTFAGGKYNQTIDFMMWGEENSAASDYAEKYGPETAARFAEIVLQNSNT